MTSSAIIITGGSATGKSTLAQRLVNQAGYKQYKVFITRLKRQNEDPSDYRHISADIFGEMADAHAFIFSEELHTNLYGVGHDAKEQFSTNTRSLIILPTWRVSDFQHAIQQECQIFHFVMHDPETAENRLKDRNTHDIAMRQSDLVRQNSAVLSKAVEIDTTVSFDEAYQIVFKTLNL